jgi:hypothetical protein
MFCQDGKERVDRSREGEMFCYLVICIFQILKPIGAGDDRAHRARSDPKGRIPGKGHERPRPDLGRLQLSKHHPSPRLRLDTLKKFALIYVICGLNFPTIGNVEVYHTCASVMFFKLLETFSFIRVHPRLNCPNIATSLRSLPSQWRQPLSALPRVEKEEGGVSDPALQTLSCVLCISWFRNARGRR